MVQVRDYHPLQDDGIINIEEWVTSLLKKMPSGTVDAETLINACELARESENSHAAGNEIWAATISSFHAGLEMATILVDLHLFDQDSLTAAILYRSVREGRLSIVSVHKLYGKSVGQLIESVLKMAVISSLRTDSRTGVFGHEAAQQAVKIREMLVSIIDDVRVALIKIVERTCAVRALKVATNEKRIRVAREIFDVYAPLAHRLGVGQLKWELEDLAFRYMENDQYKHIAQLLDERRVDRLRYIAELIKTLEFELDKEGIENTIAGRAKHIYSIWKKMQRKNVGFAEIYDIHAIRVLVPSITDCYTVLSIVHSHWKNIPNEFDDYIAIPKENGYRSLHTAVVGPQKKTIEIQIRTYGMHEDAEFGICSHWRYKGTDNKVATSCYEDKISWLRLVLEWHEELGDESVSELLRRVNATDRVYVFTPEGHVVDLTLGSTPLDFAYRIHTSIGHRCRGAKINGKIVPLNTPLQTSDQVTVLTGKTESPSLDWLSKTLHYLHTPRARSRVQQWFRKQNHEKNAAAGKVILDREIRQLNIKGVDLGRLAQQFNYKTTIELHTAIGSGVIRREHLINIFIKPNPKSSPKVPIGLPAKASRYAGSEFYIYGVGNLMTRIALCCKPLPGDQISGYVTEGRGVSIHKQDCGNFLRLQKKPERILEVSWGTVPQQVYPVKIVIDAYDRASLLRDITSVLDKAGLNILSMNSKSDEPMMGIAVRIDFTVEVANYEHLGNAMTRLRDIPNVAKVQRMDET